MRGWYGELKKKISEELGDTLVDLAEFADFMETQKRYDNTFSEKWFGTVEKQVETMNGLVGEISRMLRTSDDTSDDTSEDTSLYNPLKAVKIDRQPFVKS